MPGTLPDLLEDELSRKGWSLRELERATVEANEQLAEEGIRTRGKGVSIATISAIADRESTVEPDLRTLRLLAMAFKRPLRIFINALGYNTDEYEALADKRKQTLIQVEAAPDDVLHLVDRIVALSPEHRDGVAAFLDYLEQRKRS